jgi:hypothetical protein
LFLLFAIPPLTGIIFIPKSISFRTTMSEAHQKQNNVALSKRYDHFQPPFFIYYFYCCFFLLTAFLLLVYRYCNPSAKSVRTAARNAGDKSAGTVALRGKKNQQTKTSKVASSCSSNSVSNSTVAALRQETAPCTRKPAPTTILPMVMAPPTEAAVLAAHPTAAKATTTTRRAATRMEQVPAASAAAAAAAASAASAAPTELAA